MGTRSSFHEAFGQAVRVIRAEARLTQEELSERMGRHPTFISGIERGTRNVTLRTMLALADALETRLGAIIELAERIQSRSGSR